MDECGHSLHVPWLFHNAVGKVRKMKMFDVLTVAYSEILSVSHRFAFSIIAMFGNTPPKGKVGEGCHYWGHAVVHGFM